MVKRVAGTKDILPEEIFFWRKIEESSRNIFGIYNYKEIRTPIIEEASLFNRSLGEGTEIVQKQMFLISAASNITRPKEKSGICHEASKDTFALRPEGTAAIIRAYLENNLHKASGLTKVYYIGPMFRRERPQKGRLRQFHHLGCEAIGSQDAALDTEVISLADNLLKSYSIEGYKIKVNSLGCAKDKLKFIEILRNNLKDKLPKFCLDCQRRFETNSLRILDCKNEECIRIINKLGIQVSFLCQVCKAHFVKTRSGLDSLKIDYEVDPYLVRGLDYYNRTVFEITHHDLGAQDAIGAGGRYDNLVSELGGPCLSAIGFAFGIERLLLATSEKSKATNQNLVYIITLGEKSKTEGLKLLDVLRKNGIVSDTDYECKSLKGSLRRANDLGAKNVLIIGEDELRKGVVTLKNMATGEQKELEVKSLIAELALDVKD